MQIRRVIDILKLVSVEPYMFCCLFGYIVRLVTYQNLLINRACLNTYGYSEEVCDNLRDHKLEQKRSLELGNNLYTGVMLMSSIPATIIVIFLGPWSDKYTRRWPLIIAAGGMFTESLCCAMLTLKSNISPFYYVVIALCSGSAGGYLGASSFASSYLSDITDPRSRASRFAVLDFFLIIANLSGTVIGGQLFKAFGYLSVMCLAPVAHFGALMYAIFALKETKVCDSGTERRDMFRDLFTLDNIKQSYRTCVKKRYGNIRLQIWLLVWVDTLFKLVHMGTLMIGFAYATKMYNMDVTQYSNANTLFAAVQACLTVLSVPFFSKKLLLHEAAIGLIGIFSLLAKMVLLSVAFNVPYFYGAMLSGAISTTVGIAVRARLSKLVSKQELGKAFSLLGIFAAMAPMLGTVIFFQIYNASIDSYTGLAYTVAAALSMPSAVIFMWMTGLPTVSISEYGREDDVDDQTTTTNYENLNEEEKF